MTGSLDRARISASHASFRAHAAHSQSSRHAEPPGFTIEEFFLLGVLKDREMYGLEIARSLSAHSDFGIPSGTGVVYPMLKTLVKEGMLCSRRANGTPRIYYALTDQGRERLKAIAERLVSLGDTALLLAPEVRSSGSGMIP